VARNETEEIKKREREKKILFCGVRSVRRDGLNAREALAFTGGYHREAIPGSN
jgi:hypothetical protein